MPGLRAHLRSPCFTPHSRALVGIQAPPRLILLSVPATMLRAVVGWSFLGARQKAWKCRGNSVPMDGPFRAPSSTMGVKAMKRSVVASSGRQRSGDIRLRRLRGWLRHGVRAWFWKYGLERMDVILE
jgi:hypothetical protein